VLQVNRKTEDKPGRSAHGLTRTLINNMIEGVTKVSARASSCKASVTASTRRQRPQLLARLLAPGRLQSTRGSAFAVEGTTKVHVDGIDKQRSGKSPRDPRSPSARAVQGQGVRYEGEVVRKKLGKAGKAGKK